MNPIKLLLEWIAKYIDRLRSNFCALLYNNVYSTVQYGTVQYSSVILNSIQTKYKLGQALWARSVSEENRGGCGEKWEYLPTNRQTDNQTKSNSKAEAPFSTVVCGYSGRGPIEKYKKPKDVLKIFRNSKYDRQKQKLSVSYIPKYKSYSKFFIYDKIVLYNEILTDIEENPKKSLKMN